MTLNLRSDLPIKYLLNVHGEEDLQDDLAILFDIIRYLTHVIQVKNKELSLENFKFTSKSLKYVFGDRLNDETFKQKLVKRIKTLIVNEDLVVDGDVMKITQKGITNFYTIE